MVERLTNTLKPYLGFLLLIGSSLSLDNQCSIIVDSLTDEEFDFVYRDGTVISLEPAGTKTLQCIPERKGEYGATQCSWWKNGRVFKDSRDPRRFFTNYGCTVEVSDSYISSIYTTGGSARNNYTCSSSNNSTDAKTVMSYILYALPKKNTKVGFLPKVYDDPASKVAEPEKSVSVPCETSVSQASSVIHINWYLVNNGNHTDVRGIRNHNVSMCGRSSADKYKLTLMLTISNITSENFNQSYECVVTKVDLISPYNRTLNKYTLHSADPRVEHSVGVIPKPDMSDESNLTYYEDGTQGVCTLDKPCMITRSFLLKAPKVIHIWTYVAAGVSGAIAMMLAILFLSSYKKRVLIREYLKHQWHLTTDIANADYDYHAVIFYAERCTEDIEQFVQSKLLVKLMDKWKYDTLVPQRDYLVGSTKGEDCVRGIKNSQKVIFILTEELFAEEWKIYALDVALNKHRKIILLKMEDINFQELFEMFGKKFSEVESALKVATVIDWTKQELKWERLHLELPVIPTTSFRHRIASFLPKYQKITS
ncbi:uncharacterized protein [Watersipora subatra]|uniref:uncharacterized protein n=1 Tax=Watersipora subatra TaxID=2589382 RepID=UPI00355B5366